MKGKLPPDRFALLTREYHRTYGSLGAIAGNYVIQFNADLFIINFVSLTR